MAVKITPEDIPGMSETKPLDLDAIRRRSDAATPGPWKAGTDAHPETFPWELEISKKYPCVELDNNAQGAADAAFIAAARDDVPALLAEVGRLRAEAARLDQDVLAVIDERDEYQKRADELAHAIASVTGADLGEHSNMNDPWRNALDAAKRLQRSAEPAA